MAEALAAERAHAWEREFEQRQWEWEWDCRDNPLPLAAADCSVLVQALDDLHSGRVPYGEFIRFFAERDHDWHREQAGGAGGRGELRDWRGKAHPDGGEYGGQSAG